MVAFLRASNLVFLRPLLRPFKLHFVISQSIPSSFPTKSLPFSSLSPKFNMSSRPSAFDALMSNARRAAKKNPQSSSPSKKRKAPDSTLSQNPEVSTEPISEEAASDDHRVRPNCVKKPAADLSTAGSDDALKPQESKKVKVDCSEELKRKIGSLKKKPADFDPQTVVYWKKGDKVPFLFLCLAFDLISNETGRIIITDIVCNTFRTVIETTPDDLLPVVYLAANKIAAAHEGLELGIGDASIIKALAEAFGKTEARVKEQYKEKGDLGLVAQASRKSQRMMWKPDPLTVVEVFDKFQLIAKESGKDSQEKKKNHIISLLVAATDCEPLYLIRLLQGKLRIGLAEQTLLASLGHATVHSENSSKPPSSLQASLEEAAKIVKQVYSVIPVYEKIVPALLASGVWNLQKTCSFIPGVPIGPMLAKPTKGVEEIITKFQDTEFICEYKYDGERAQIHYMDDGSIEIYSRNAERNTGKYPDIANAISRFKKSSVDSFVLDCEVVAYDRESKKILPFQILTTRARKNVVMSDIKVQVCLFVFDILYLNGKSLLQESLRDRKERLYESFEEDPGFFQFATALTSNDIEELQKFLDAAVSAGCEGLIIKTLDRDATYEPSKRSLNWLKLKKDYMESIGDTLDLVPIAGFEGRGKRAGVYGAFLLACYDPGNEEFQTICKIGTGFSDAMLEERSSSLRSKVIPKPKTYYSYGDTINPDVWFEPTEVWEVKAADLTISPVYRAATGIVDPNKGISLRFPRLIRVREDKTPELATSSEQVAEMYSAQKLNHVNNQDRDDED